MRLRTFILALLVSVLTVGLAHGADSSVQAIPTGTGEKPMRVLFIGNSLTFQNNLPAMLRVLCEQSTPPIKIEVAQVVQGGFTLEKHWNGEKALKKIQEGGWDYVVLQENSAGPVQYKDGMFKNAKLFGAEIKKINAKVLLYMTWALQKTPDDHVKITAAYEDLGKELGATVVPVGIARLKAVERDAAQNFYVKDGKHPTPAATYLAACTFYITLTGRAPKGLPAKIVDPANPKKILVDITPDQAAFLQSVAEDTLRARTLK